MARLPINGVSLNVTEMPARPGLLRRRAEPVPVVMVHGLAASQAFWYAAGASFLTMLGPVLLYDLRGHGKSEAPPTGYGVGDMADDLHALLRDRGIERAHIVAHSFGGMIALAHALRHPETVASLTLADVRVRPIQTRIVIPARQLPPVVERRLAALGLDLGGVAAHDDGIGYLRTVARIEVEAGEEASELLSEIYRHPRLFRTRKNAERWIALTERVSLIADLDRERLFGAEDLRALRMPMLILVGAQSSTVPSARELARLCPHAHLREIPDVGHFFPMSQPRLFLRPTLRFLHAVNRGGRASGPAGGPAPSLTPPRLR
jgi:pimeloyl-ACP methyl ester carboxylesterase